MSPFANSLEHLLAELERLDICVRSQIAAMRRIAVGDAGLRGLYIAEEDVDALLRQPLGQPHWPVAAPQAAALAELQAHIDQRRQLSLAHGIDLRLPRLQQSFALGRFEVDALLLALAVELDLRYERLYGYLQDDVTRKRPSVGLVLNLLAPALSDRIAARGCFNAEARLRASRLVALLDDPAQPQPPLLARFVKVEDRVVRFLLGDDELDERLLPLVQRVSAATHLDGLLLDDAVAQSLRTVIKQTAAGQPLLVHLVGAPGSGKREAAAAVAQELGRPLLVADIERLLADGSFEATWPLIEREAQLQSAPLYCSGFDGLLAAAQRPALESWARRLQGRGGLVFIAGRRAFEPAGDARDLPFVRIALPVLDVAQRTAVWRAELGELLASNGALDAAAVASKFKFGPVQIRDAAATVRRAAARPAAPALTPHDLHDACRLHSNQQLSNVARKITPKYRWDDIVLPVDRLTMLRDICNHMKYRSQVYGDWGFGRKLAMGKGLAVLFAGPSGTGKTMAADIIAGELGLDLFKIDLASVISKYIGETEKNLGSIFDEAETSNAILFFDEADALFGKRSEVKDSHDRYANVEVGYLLQRLEEYEGVAILATNFRKNMDEAFVRRLHFTVEFPFPTHADRRSIWASIWPHETPRDDAIDADDLGRRFEMTGGNIRNVALAAAFLAADDGGRVQIGHVMRATQREYQKMGKLIDDRAFAA